MRVIDDVRWLSEAAHSKDPFVYLVVRTCVLPTSVYVKYNPMLLQKLVDLDFWNKFKKGQI